MFLNTYLSLINIYLSVSSAFLCWIPRHFWGPRQADGRDPQELHDHLSCSAYLGVFGWQRWSIDGTFINFLIFDSWWKMVKTIWNILKPNEPEPNKAGWKDARAGFQYGFHRASLFAVLFPFLPFLPFLSLDLTRGTWYRCLGLGSLETREQQSDALHVTWHIVAPCSCNKLQQGTEGRRP